MAELAWLAGLIWPITLPYPLIPVIVILTVAALLLRKLRPVLAVLLILIFSLLGSSYLQSYLTSTQPQLTFEQPVELKLTILDKPNKYDTQARYFGRTSEGWYISFYLPRTDQLPPGTDILITGTLMPPSSQADNSILLGLAKKQVYARLLRPKILLKQPARLNSWERFLLMTRSRFDHTINQLFAQPYASLFAGIVAGLKSDLPEDIVMSFQLVGLSHIIAVSGFNLTIVMNLVGRLTEPLGRWPNFGISLTVLIFAVLFTGASASVVRAGVFAAILLLAGLLYRQISVPRLLILAAVLMTIQNPLALSYDIGFQLSFGAIVGLAFFAEPITKELVRCRLPP